MPARAAAASLAAGTMVARYRVERPIGVGGMGEVYAATDTTLGRRVALKILPQSRATDAERVRRFIREAEAASALNHPAIVAVYDSGTTTVDGDTLHFVAMELVEGETLATWSRATRDLRRKLELLAGVADGLSRAHADGIVHRDLKPDNIMVAKGGYPKILDFGIAKLTERAATNGENDTAPEAILGTAGYMSPEQAAGRLVDPRSDVFSFGCVMYDALTGRAPFRRANSVETMHAILHDDPPPTTGLPREVDRVLRRCLAKDPEERYQSIRDVALDLRSIARDLDLAPAAPSPRRLWPYALLVVLLVAASSIATYLLTRAKPGAEKPMHMERVTNTGQVVTGAISPDGKYLVYATREGALQTLWTKQIATGTHVRVLPPAEVYFSGMAVSAGGDYAFYSAATRAEPNVVDVFQVPILGGEPRLVAKDMESVFAVSPDGKQIAFRRFNAFERDWVLTVADIDSGAERVLLRKRYPEQIAAVTWAPDGKRVTFVNFLQAPKPEVQFLNADVTTGALSHVPFARDGIAKGWGGVGSITWVPDGSGLLVSASGLRQPAQIWFVPAGGGEPHKVTSDISSYYSISLTHDGQTLVAERGEASVNVWRVALHERPAQPQALTTGIGVRYGTGGVRWMPDGSIGFVAWEDGKPVLEAVDGPGQPRRRLLRSRPVWHPVISSDGSRLAFLGGGPGSVEIWTANLDGSEVKQLTNGARPLMPAFYPDGRTVAYVASNKQQRVFRQSIDGGEPVQVTDRPTNMISVSPDGKHLLCRLRSTDPKTALWRTAVVPLAGGAPRFYDVPRYGGAIYLQWFPDSRSFVFADQKDGISNLWLQDLAGGEPRQITWFDSGQIYSFDISKDGKHAALSRGDPVNDLVLIRDFR